jgi:antirestriction protein ArdC
MAYRTPFNAVTGREYQNTNIEHLMDQAEVMGYDPSKGWATFRQWRQVGRTVRYFEKSTPVYFSQGYDKALGRVVGAGYIKGYAIFHEDQLDPLN